MKPDQHDNPLFPAQAGIQRFFAVPPCELDSRLRGMSG